MHEILDLLPPEAEIVSGPGAHEHTVMPTNLADATEYVLAGEEAKESAPDFRFKETGSLRPDTPPIAKIDASRPSRKPKRPEPNIALEFVKVVIGGIAGLALAMLAVMWFLHQDPMGIVKQLPVQAYMVVPEQLRTDEMKQYAKGDQAVQEAGEEEEVELTVEKISIDKFPVAEESVPQPPSEEPSLPVDPGMTPSIAEPSLEIPAVKEPVGAEPAAEASPTPNDQVSDPNAPKELTLKEETSMATEASKLLGEIGAQMPEPPGSESTPPTNVGNVDLSPVDDGEN
ncbi:hypothetical protein [Blastopirellula marina]|nr:hypothetical protein [Blastopirellula marina]